MDPKKISLIGGHRISSTHIVFSLYRRLREAVHRKKSAEATDIFHTGGRGGSTPFHSFWFFFFLKGGIKKQFSAVQNSSIGLIVGPSGTTNNQSLYNITE